MIVVKNAAIDTATIDTLSAIFLLTSLPLHLLQIIQFSPIL
nr:MAG TPA: hypothetical protein [Caudoviricetes sp.]